MAESSKSTSKSATKAEVEAPTGFRVQTQTTDPNVVDADGNPLVVSTSEHTVEADSEAAARRNMDARLTANESIVLVEKLSG